MVTAASGPYKTLKSLIESAKARHGELPFASAGIGTSTHLAAEYLIDLAGLKMIHVPFKGSPDAMQDVLGGRSAFYMAPINAGMTLVKDGKLTALGVSTKGRADVLPEEMAKRMAEELPSAQLVVVPGAGHTVPGDQPALFQSLLQEFLMS